MKHITTHITSGYILKPYFNEKKLGTVFIIGNGDINTIYMFTQSRKHLQSCLEAIFDYFEFTEDKIKIEVPQMLISRHEKMIEEFEKKMIENNIDLELYIYE